MPEPSLQDQLLADYDQHEDNIEQAASTELWALGDWLVEYVPDGTVGRPPRNRPLERPITIKDLVGRRGRGLTWLKDLRKIAESTAVDRLPQITPRVYLEAMRQNGWDLMAANASLVTKGHRLRDQTGKMESVKALIESLGKRTPTERADIARDLMSDPTVSELLGDVDPASFGAEWADNLVLRVHTNVESLSALIAREGLRFAPSTPLDEMLDFLSEAERQLAEVRAAVQERLQDETVGEVC